MSRLLSTESTEAARAHQAKLDQVFSQLAQALPELLGYMALGEIAVQTHRPPENQRHPSTQASIVAKATVTHPLFHRYEPGFRGQQVAETRQGTTVAGFGEFSSGESLVSGFVGNNIPRYDHLPQVQTGDPRLWEDLTSQPPHRVVTQSPLPAGPITPHDKITHALHREINDNFANDPVGLRLWQLEQALMGMKPQSSEYTRLVAQVAEIQSRFFPPQHELIDDDIPF